MKIPLSQMCTSKLFEINSVNFSNNKITLIVSVKMKYVVLFLVVGCFKWKTPIVMF